MDLSALRPMVERVALLRAERQRRRACFDILPAGMDDAGSAGRNGASHGRRTKRSNDGGARASPMEAFFRVVSSGDFRSQDMKTLSRSQMFSTLHVCHGSADVPPLVG